VIYPHENFPTLKLAMPAAAIIKWLAIARGNHASQTTGGTITYRPKGEGGMKKNLHVVTVALPNGPKLGPNGNTCNTDFLAALQRVVNGDHGEAHRALNETMLRLRWLNERRLPSAASMTNARRLEKLGREALRFAWKMRFRFRAMFLATEIWHAVRCYLRAIIARTIAVAWWLLDGR
jgi:hypothetical protein